MKFEVLLLFQRFSAVLACPWATPLHGYKKRCAICGSFWRKDLTGTISISQSTGIPQGGSWFPLALNLRDSHMDSLKDSAGFRSRLRLEGLDHFGSCWIMLDHLAGFLRKVVRMSQGDHFGHGGRVLGRFEPSAISVRLIP